MWQTANVSADGELILACVPTLVSLYAEAPMDLRLLEVTELVGLKYLLSDERSHRLSAHSRVSSVAAWVKAAPTAESQQHRIDAFAGLVELIQFNENPLIDIIDFFFTDSFRSLPASCR